MNISFDKFEQFEDPVLTLCNPNSEATIKDGKVTLSHTLGMLPDCKKINLSPNFNTQWELSFEFPDSKNEHLHYVYKRLEKGRYIYVSDVGYFMIDDYARHESDERVYKEISCHSVDKEIKRNDCPLLDEGSYYFSTKENDDGTATEGIIQKQMALLPKWTLGFVSDDLKDKTAYFDGENKSDNAYEFLWEEVEEAYECVIDVDFISRTLSFYSLEYYAAHHKTDIHLSKSNDLKEVVIESKDDDCFTAITVKQGDNLSLVYSNPNGSETLYNFTHCFSDMSPELQAALTKWQEKYEATTIPYRTLSEQWANALDDLTNAEKDLDILKDELNNLKISRDTVINATASEETKQANLDTVNANISAQEQAISDQENVIAAKKVNIKTTYEEPLQAYANECSLSLTAKDISGNLIFTQELLNELSAYINPAEYSDDYISQTDDMKYTEIYQQSNKLFDRAKRELEKLSTQSYTFSVENNSFLFNKKFERFSRQLIPGAIVYLETSDDHMEQVHLTNFSINYDDCSVSFTFGNKYDENDIKSLFDDVFGSVKTSAAAVKYLKNIVNDQRSELDKQRDWIDNALTLTKNHFLTSNNQSVIIDDSGYWGRRQSTDADGNLIFDTKGNPIYDNEQLRIVNNTITITKDNWQRIATAIGKIYLYHDDATGEDVYEYGVAGKLLLGDMIIGKTLSLLGSPRADGTYAITLNENGLTIINDGTSAGITIKDANGNNQFYADDDGNLWLSGNINAIGGTIGGWNIDNYGLYFNNGDIGCGLWGTSAHDNIAIHAGANAANIGTAPFRVCHDGSLYSTKGNVAGWDLDTNRITKVIDCGGTVGLRRVAMCSNNNEPAFYVTGSDPANSLFRVDWDGSLYASEANITGTIYATGGTVGGWLIGTQTIENIDSGSGSGGAGMSCNVGHWAFWAGANGGWSPNVTAPFRVGHNGALIATSADITGTIRAGSIVTLNIEGTGDGFKLGNLSLWNNSQGTVFYSPYSSGNNRAYLSLGYTTASLSMSRGVGVIIDANGTGTLHGTWAYANGSSGSLSDRNAKTDIASFTDSYDYLFDNLQPCLYKYVNGTSNRKHFGLIAQDTEKAILQSNLTQKDVAFIMDVDYHDEKGNKLSNKFIRYEEFVALNIWQIQKLKKRIKELEKIIEGLV